MAIDTNKLMNVFGVNNDTQLETFDDDPEEDYDGPVAPIIKNTEASPVTEKDMDNDIDYTLRTQSNLINQAQKAVQIALENAQNGGTARDIEVLSETINTATNSVEKLLDLHTKIKKLKEMNPEPEAKNVQYVQNQVVFRGTTSDALRAIKEKLHAN